MRLVRMALWAGLASLLGCWQKAPASYQCDEPGRHCQANETCENFKCYKICATSQDCDLGVACLDGKCKPYVRECIDDASCIPDWHCGEDEMCAKNLRTGSECNADRDCLSNHCANGRCCRTACDGTCMSCRGQDSGDPVNDGLCLPIAATTDPYEECPGATSCDGAGACYGVELGVACSDNYECVSGFCAPDGVCCDAACDGTCEACGGGTCQPIPAGEDPYNECGGETACNGQRACFAKELGASCDNAYECTSALCVDYRCCNEACTGTCQSCNTAASPGQCVAVTDQRDEDTCGTTTLAGACAEAPCMCSNGQCTPDTCKQDEFHCTSAPGGCCKVTAFAAGSYHTCALTRGGGVKCWGDNGYGQLGNNSTTDSSVPADVVNPSGVTMTAIATGDRHTCALTSSGGVKCWGDNGYGQLGNNSTTDSSVPVDVVNSSGVTMTAIDTGSDYTCALTSSGGVKCWGYNYYGQLGNNSTISRSTPVDVDGLDGVTTTAIAAALYHTCAVTGSGQVKCWGANFFGQLGNNSTTHSRKPVDVENLGGAIFTAIAAGTQHTCALTSSGQVKCWGWNSYSQLGNNSTTDSSVPVDVVGLNGLTITAIAGGGGHTCALTSSGQVKCWGYNPDGRLGNRDTTNSSVPVDVVGLSGVTMINAGDQAGHTCAITSTGGKCWGNNSSGQLGNGTTGNGLIPVLVAF